MLATTQDVLFMVDDLSAGSSPENWLANPACEEKSDLKIFEKGRLIFLKDDFRNFLFSMRNDFDFINRKYGFRC